MNKVSKLQLFFFKLLNYCKNEIKIQTSKVKPKYLFLTITSSYLVSVIIFYINEVFFEYMNYKKLFFKYLVLLKQIINQSC